MERNLDHRVEVVFPIEKPETIRYLRDKVLESYLHDNQRARLMLPNGHYKRRKPADDEKPFDVQNYLMQAEREP